MPTTIKSIRLSKEITQKDMATALNVCVDTYRKMESNPESITIEQAKKIAARLGVSYDQIVFA